ncbi:hypothetical protein [Aquibacillus saliphilus]|uniref:hypothetical protein n=1 Tax=Aquibacillus saliphilus TaxID=1909422 RepID=UPI001CF046DB|nr:hypothetical protein [Aquibacillus saliphilus]
MIINWTRLQIIVLIGAVVLAISFYFIGYFTYLVPVTNEIEEEKERLNIQEQVLANSMEESETVDDTNLSTQMQQSLPIEKGTDQLLVLLNEIQNDSNSEIIQMTSADTEVENMVGTDEQTDLEDLKATQYQLQVSTDSYQSMYDFLQGLKEANRLLNIEQIQFGEETDNNLDFSVTFSAYFSPSLQNLIIESPSYQFVPTGEKTTPFPK